MLVAMTTKFTNKTILIVEDDPFIAMDLEDTFKMVGYDVLGPFADVENALATLQKRPPNVAILDYNLGKETSIPIAKKLHKEEIPYMFLSGQVATVVISPDIPARPVINKPFVPEQLVELVHSLAA